MNDRQRPSPAMEETGNYMTIETASEEPDSKAAARITHVHVQVNPTSRQAPRFSREEMLAAADAAGIEPGRVRMTFGQVTADLVAALETCEVLLMTGSADLTATRDAPRLRWINYTSAGVETLQGAPIPACVTVTNASGNHDVRTAEFAATALLMLNNQIPYFAQQQAARTWSPVALDPLAGKVVTVLGMGALGTAAARMAKQLGLRVVGVSRSGRPHPLADACYSSGRLHEALAGADFLLITLPQTPATTGLVGPAELDALPAHAGIVNIGRSPVLDWHALAERLDDGRLGGAVLDVFDEEPLPPHSPLWRTRNLMVIPHSGLYDDGYPVRCRTSFLEQLKAYLAGEPLRAVVDLRQGY